MNDIELIEKVREFFKNPDKAIKIYTIERIANDKSNGLRDILNGRLKSFSIAKREKYLPILERYGFKY